MKEKSHTCRKVIFENKVIIKFSRMQTKISCSIEILKRNNYLFDMKGFTMVAVERLKNC